MIHVRYLKSFGSKTKGDIELQPDMVAETLIDQGLAEFSFDPETQADIDELEAEVDADKRGEEYGLSTGDELEAEQLADDETESPATDHDNKPPITRESVRRAVRDNSKAKTASLSDEDIAAGAEHED